MNPTSEALTNATSNGNIPFLSLFSAVFASIAALAGTVYVAIRNGGTEKIKSIDQRISEAFDAKDSLLQQYRDQLTETRTALTKAEDRERETAAELTRLRGEVANMAARIATLTAEVNRLSGLEANYSTLQVEYQIALDHISYLQAELIRNNIAVPAWEPKRATRPSSAGPRPDAVDHDTGH